MKRETWNDDLPLHFISPAIRIRGEDGFDLIAHAAEDVHDFFLAAGGVGGVVEGPVVAVELAGIHRAGLIGVAADGDDGLDIADEEVVHVLARVRGDVDADLGHRLDAERMDVACGLRSGAGDFENITRHMAQQAFGKVGTAGVAGAEDEDERFGWSHGEVECC